MLWVIICVGFCKFIDFEYVLGEREEEEEDEETLDCYFCFFEFKIVLY